MTRELTAYRVDLRRIPGDGQHLPERGLLIRAPHINRILDGSKSWEIRGTRTNLRGRIALIRSGSSSIFGESRILDCVGTLSFAELLSAPQLPPEERAEFAHEGELPYLSKETKASKTYAWILGDVCTYDGPLVYRHPSGAVIFVNLTSPGIVSCSSPSFSTRSPQLELF